MILWQLFWLFARVSVLAFGGAISMLPEIQRVVVEDYAWMNQQDLIQTYVVSQFVPGPNMVMATLIGYKVAGWSGALASSLGMYLAPIMIVAITTTLYFRHRQSIAVRQLEVALRPVVLALVSGSILMFLVQQLGSDWKLGLTIGVPIAWLHWQRRLNAVTGVLLSGALWWGVWQAGESLRMTERGAVFEGNIQGGGSAP